MNRLKIDVSLVQFWTIPSLGAPISPFRRAFCFIYFGVRFALKSRAKRIDQISSRDKQKPSMNR